MKKIAFVVFLLFFLFCNYRLVEANQLNLRAGLNYNTYQLEELNEFVVERNGEAINEGIAFNLGIKKEIYNNISVGIEGEYMSIYYDDLSNGKELKASNTGILLIGGYNFFDKLRLNAGVGQYVAMVDYFAGDDTAYAPGIKLGGESDFSIRDNLDVIFRGNYRLASPGDYDFSGWEIGFLAEIIL